MTTSKDTFATLPPLGFDPTTGFGWVVHVMPGGVTYAGVSYLVQRCEYRHKNECRDLWDRGLWSQRDSIHAHQVRISLSGKPQEVVALIEPTPSGWSGKVKGKEAVWEFPDEPTALWESWALIDSANKEGQ